MPLRGRLSASGAGSVVATSCWALLVLVFLGILSCCHAYFVGNQIQIQPRSSTNFQNNKDLGPFIARHKLPSRQFSRRFHTSLSSSGDLETEISSLCDADRFEKAIEILERESLGAHTKSCYATILKNLADREEQLEEQRIEEKSSVISKPPSDKDTVRYLQSSRILDRLLELGKLDSELLPTADDFNCVIKMWATTGSAPKGGLWLAKTKYTVTQRDMAMESGDYTFKYAFGTKPKGGVHIIKTTNQIVCGFYSEEKGQNAGNAKKAVLAFAEYLMSIGY